MHSLLKARKVLLSLRPASYLTSPLFQLTKKTRSDTTMRSPHKSPLANGTTPAYSSPNLPHNSRKPQLIPISSRTSSLDSLVALGGNDGVAPRRGNPVVAPSRRVLKNAFSSNSNETVVPPT